MMKYMLDLDEYSLQNVDEVIKIYAPGNRPTSPAAQNYTKQNSTLFLHSQKRHCLRAALVNALVCVAGARRQKNASTGSGS